LPHFLFMGGDFPRKGGDDLLAAWEDGAFAGRATLELVTDWPIDRQLPAGVTRTERIAPHTAEWRALWRRADAFVMPTRSEAFGLVYQEAAAAGIPAIGTRHHAVPEIVLDAETGLLVPIGHRDALVQAMNALVESAELRDRLGRRGRSRIEEVADPWRYMETLTDIVRDVLPA
jgi:glycosyltransferase involved in cell wall biosynthesis